MSNVTIETEKPAVATQPSEPQSKPNKTVKAAKPRKAVKAPKKTAKKAAAKPTKKGNTKPVAARSNKKAEVIALMKRPKGATLAEIGAATGWQKHTVRGFVSILGKKGETQIESSKNASGERTYKIAR